MADDVLQSLLATIRHSSEGDLPEQWAEQTAAVLGLNGVAVSVSLNGPELVYFSDELSARLENLQLTLGEGPGIEAASSGAMCLLADVRTAAGPQWTGFLSQVAGLPLRAVFAFPLRLGALRVGAFTGYRRTPGMLSHQQVEDALLLCDAMTEFLLRLRLPGPEADGESPDGAGTMALHRVEVHQATGMIAAQLGIPLPAAISRLRAEAFLLGSDITDVARAVIDREMTLTADGPTGGTRNGSAPRE